MSSSTSKIAHGLMEVSNLIDSISEEIPEEKYTEMNSKILKCFANFLSHMRKYKVDIGLLIECHQIIKDNKLEKYFSGYKIIPEEDSSSANYSEKDITIVMKQADVSKKEAIEALDSNKGDIVDTILALRPPGTLFYPLSPDSTSNNSPKKTPEQIDSMMMAMLSNFPDELFK